MSPPARPSGQPQETAPSVFFPVSTPSPSSFRWRPPLLFRAPAPSRLPPQHDASTTNHRRRSAGEAEAPLQPPHLAVAARPHHPTRRPCTRSGDRSWHRCAAPTVLGAYSLVEAAAALSSVGGPSTQSRYDDVTASSYVQRLVPVFHLGSPKAIFRCFQFHRIREVCLLNS